MTSKRRLKTLEQNQNQDKVYYVRVSWQAEGEPEPPAEQVELLVVINGEKVNMTLKEFNERFPDYVHETKVITWKDV